MKESASVAPTASRLAWPADLPQHWTVKPLKHCVTLAREKADGRDSGLPYLGLEHIESWTGRRLISEEKPEADGEVIRFRPGDVLFGKLRPYLAKVFRADEDGVCTGELLDLRPRGVDQGFFFYYLLCRDFISLVDSSTYGAKMPRASWDFIGSIPLALPFTEEQRAIAAFLDRETARIDALIAKKQRQIELLQEKRAAMTTRVVTRGVEAGTPTKRIATGWMAEIPIHWTTIRLRRVGVVDQGCSFPEAIQGEAEGEIPWYKVDDMNRAGNEVLMDEAENYVSADVAQTAGATVFPAGTIVFPRVGAALLTNKRRILTRPSITDDNLYGFAPRAIHPRFAYHVLCQIDLGSLRSPGLVPTITIPAVKDIEIPLPPAQEQQAIAQRLDQEHVESAKIEHRVRRSVDVLRELREALISAAVQGKMDVREEIA